MTVPILALAIASWPAEDLTLRAQYTAGESHAYRVVQQYRDPATGDVTEFEDDVTFVVLEVNDLGQARIETRWKPVALRMDGTEIPLTPDKGTTTLTERRSPTGQVRDRTPFPNDDVRTRRAWRPFETVLPSPLVRIGSSWTEATRRDEGSDLPDATWRWQWGETHGDEAVIAFEFSESNVADPILASGVLRLDVRTGWPIAVDGTAANVMVPGDEERVLHVLKFSMRRRA